MSETIEVNLPTYQMEPDPPRFPLRKLIRYMVLLVLIWAGYTYRAEIVDLAKQAFAKFDTAMPPPRDAPPPAMPIVVTAPPAPSDQPLPGAVTVKIGPGAGPPSSHVDEQPESKARPTTRPNPRPLVEDEAVEAGAEDEPQFTEPSRARRLEVASSTARWVQLQAIPLAVRQSAGQGSVVAVMVVGTQGRPKSCRIKKRSGYPEMDRSICRQLLTNARFRPALNDDGQPVEAEHEYELHWKP